MRPTIDEQLRGAARLLRLAERDPGAAPGVVELVRNARRLVERVGTSWSAALPFLQEDNVRLARLLGADVDLDARDLAAAVATNEALRAQLTERIRGLPPGPDRTAIGVYLRERITADPT